LNLNVALLRAVPKIYVERLSRLTATCGTFFLITDKVYLNVALQNPLKEGRP
jgi:hypothetical protein